MIHTFLPKILYEDNHLLIVNKPTGILSQADNTRDDDMISMAKRYVKKKYDKPGEVYMGLPHRIDRPVSGALILCRTSKALSRMTEQFRNKKVEKIYHAIITDRPENLHGTLRSHLRKSDKKNKTNVSTKSFSGSKEAVLHYTLIGQLKEFALLEIKLETGRPHQIRAQLNQFKMPIYGDLKYKPQRPLPDKSIALHALSLQFLHPVKKEPMRITAKYPKSEWWSMFG